MIFQSIDISKVSISTLSQAYKDSYPSIPLNICTHEPLRARPYHGAWNPTDFIYMDGSQVTGNTILGTSIVNPKSHTITHIEIKSQPERHTINRAELAAITIALETNKHENSLSILTDSTFSINTIPRYAIDPLSFTHHPYKHLLQLTYNIIHSRDDMEYKALIGRVESHTGVTHNDEADTTARDIVEGRKTPDITFSDANPPIEGLRTWPQIKKK